MIRLPAQKCLVLGGARSGKSGFAQKLAEESGLSPLLIATAQAFDDEMTARIARHAAERDRRWHLVEEPIALTDALVATASPDRVCVVDCATLWLSNLMLAGHDVAAATRDLVAALDRLAGPVVFVSNEVGAGIVPENALARWFRDAQGRLNQALGAACDTVVLMSAGLPLVLKPSLMPKIVLGSAQQR